MIGQWITGNRRLVVRVFVPIAALAAIGLGLFYLTPSTHVPDKLLDPEIGDAWDYVNSHSVCSKDEPQLKARLAANLKQYEVEIGRGSTSSLQAAGLIRRLHRESGIREGTFFLPIYLKKVVIQGKQLWICGEAWEWASPDMLRVLGHVRVIVIDTRWPYRVIKSESCG